MRLTCPNCSAQYEVPDEVIPEGGRDVQCSNCEQTWFQAKHPQEPPVAAEKTPEPEPEIQVEQPKADEPDQDPQDVASDPAADLPDPGSNDPEVEAPEPKMDEAEADAPEKVTATGNVDPDVASILKEEAAREAELRAKEGTGLESQPDLALDAPAEPKVQPKRPGATETAEDAGQKDDLPDVEAINSGLMENQASDSTEAAVTAARKSGGFMRGFALIIIIGVILFLLYGNATKISEAVPQAEPAMQSLVSMIDQARFWLEAQSGAGSQ